MPAEAPRPGDRVESVVFSCFNQDQDIDVVDFASLRARLGQNGVQEKLTRQWIDRTLQVAGPAVRKPLSEAAPWGPLMAGARALSDPLAGHLLPSGKR